MILLTALIIQSLIDYRNYDINHLKLVVAFTVITAISDIVILHITIKNRKELFAKE